MNEEYQPFSDLWTGQIMLLRAAWPPILLFVLFWAIPYIWVDIFYYESDAAYFLLSFVSVGLNFVLLFYLMDRSGNLKNGARSGIVYFFFLSTVHTLGVLVGLIFLIVPGIYIASRWLPSFAHLLASGEGIGAALGWSWRETQTGEWILMKNMLGPTLLYAISLGVVLLPDTQALLVTETSPDSFYAAQIVFSNLAFALGLAWHNILGVAVYSSIQGSDTPLKAVFE